MRPKSPDAISTDNGSWRAPRARRSSLKAIARRLLLSACGATERLVDRNSVLLTFDDGPDPVVTQAVLDLLAEYDAKAVFFIVGNRIPRAPHMLPKILAGGHVIGNHSFQHPLDRVLPLADYYRDIKACQEVIESHTGHQPQLFRPPLGALTPGSLLAPRLAGLKTLLWSIDVDDWRLRRDEEAVLAGRQLAESVGPGDVVLLHDDNPCVVKLLETTLPRLRERRLDLAKAAAQT